MAALHQSTIPKWRYEVSEVAVVVHPVSISALTATACLVANVILRLSRRIMWPKP